MFARPAVFFLSLFLIACASQRTYEPVPTPDEATLALRNEMTLALLGATGMVGRHLLEQALQQGYQVRALARSPEKLKAYGDRITIVQGDARDADTIDALLKDSDFVLSAIGPVKGDGVAAKTISTTTTGHVTRAMSRYGISRYIFVSGAAVVIPGDKRNLVGRLVKTMADLSLRDAVKDKQAEYRVLENSSIDWTAVRCPIIKNRSYQLEPIASVRSLSGFSVRAGEVAHFMLQQIDSNAYSRQGPFLYSQ